MEKDFKEAFYMIIAGVLMALVITSIAIPVYTKIGSSKSRIETLDFTTDGKLVSP